MMRLVLLAVLLVLALLALFPPIAEGAGGSSWLVTQSRQGCDHLAGFEGGGWKYSLTDRLCCKNGTCLDASGARKPSRDLVSLRKRKVVREQRYADAKARGDHIGMQRYSASVGKIVKQDKGFLGGIDWKRARLRCPPGWKASGDDMCCEQWWPDGRAQKCKTMSTGAVWSRTWKAKKLGQK